MCVCFIKVSLAPATIIGCHLLRLLRGGRRRRRRPTRPVRALLDRQTKAVAPLVNHARSSAKRPRPEAQVERARVQHSREPGDLRRRALPGPTQSGQRIETNGNCARSLPRVHALKSKRRHTSARCAICYGSSKSAPAMSDRRFVSSASHFSRENAGRAGEVRAALLRRAVHGPTERDSGELTSD